MTTRPTLPQIPLVGGERELLRAFLDYYRAALLDRAWGLDETQLNLRLEPSTLTLARLIGHMTVVEYGWFRDVFDDGGVPELYQTMDWQADRDAEMTRAEGLDRETLVAEFEAAVADSRRREAGADSLDVESKAERDRTWNLRWIMIHMIEEYARHCGHADFLREAIDGDTVD